MMLKALVLIVACFINEALAAPAADAVAMLPNITLTEQMYSGYLKVTETKQLHYVFVESNSSSAADDPVLIWFNGGPGCSSLLGFFQENGPLIVEENGDTSVNPYPWNSRANVLYIESPAGVGFSLAGEKHDWHHNDMSQSEDAFAALQVWYQKFPEYEQNPLWISGESYAGIYVPYLSWQIYQHNQMVQFRPQLKVINFKGTMVGNGATNWDFDVSPSFPQTAYNFNLVPKKQAEFMKVNDCNYYFNELRPHSGPNTCDAPWERIQNLTADLNWYDLYETAADSPIQDQYETIEDRTRTVEIGGVNKTYISGRTKAEYTPWVKHFGEKSRKLQRVEAKSLSEYINAPETRKALNIPDSAPAWNQCTPEDSHFTYHYQQEASMWIYPVLKAHNIPMMFYSGDTDGAVPTYGSKRWIKELNYPVTKEWSQWTTDGQVSGYIQEYDGLDFLTVKGVGHMAPQQARKSVTSMIMAHIHGEPIGPF